MLIKTLVNIYLPCLSGIGATLPQFDAINISQCSFASPGRDWSAAGELAPSGGQRHPTTGRGGTMEIYLGPNIGTL